ncbi:MAG: hypothetical protein J6Q45_05920, partial [Alistipes sp.]|nr:hypothetical protein [Alistipes sp.]
MRRFIHILFALFVAFSAAAQPMKSIKVYGVLPSNTPEQNKANLQRAIDIASETGAALYVEPEVGGYPIAAGVVLKRNVSLIGAHGPVGR